MATGCNGFAMNDTDDKQTYVNVMIPNSGGDASSMHNFGYDLSHKEAIEQLREVMAINEKLRNSIHMNTQNLAYQSTYISNFIEQQKQQDENVKRHHARAKQVVNDLQLEVDNRNQNIKKLTSEITKLKLVSAPTEEMSMNLRQPAAASSGSQIPVMVDCQVATQPDLNSVILQAEREGSDLETMFDDVCVHTPPNRREEPLPTEGQTLRQLQKANSNEHTLQRQVSQLFQDIKEKNRTIDALQQELQKCKVEYEQKQDETDSLIAALNKQYKDERSKNLEQNRKFEQLATDHHNLLMKQSTQEQEARIHDLTEHLMAAEAKRNEFEAVKQDLHARLMNCQDELTKRNKTVEEKKTFIEVLEATKNIYESDFNAERKAREDQNSEKVQLKIHNEKLIKQLHASQKQVEDLQQRLHMDQESQQSPAFGAQPRPQHMTEPHSFMCPMCNDKFPDQDSLQLHSLQCESLN